MHGKLQIPSFKPQRSSKSQISNPKPGERAFGNWSLGFFWSLSFGFWNFPGLRRAGGSCFTHRDNHLPLLGPAISAEASAPQAGSWFLRFGSFLSSILYPLSSAAAFLLLGLTASAQLSSLSIYKIEIRHFA